MKYSLKRNSFYYNIRYLLGEKKKSIYELFEHILFKKSLKQSILPYREKYKVKRQNFNRMFANLIIVCTRMFQKDKKFINNDIESKKYDIKNVN